MDFDHAKERLASPEAQQRYRIATLKEARETGHTLSTRGSSVGKRILDGLKPTERYSDFPELPPTSRRR